MARKDSIYELIEPVIKGEGFYLEDVAVATPGKSRIVTIIVDGDQALTLDQVTVVTKAISELLDSSPLMGEAPFTLEVTSPGVDRPLTKPRHWRQNATRKVRIILSDGREIHGRILSVDDNVVTLSEPEATIAYSDIKRATVEIEFNKKEAR